MALPVPDSPRSTSKTFTISKDHNIHSLTPRQQAIHHQTIQRHLSARGSPALTSFSTSKSKAIKVDTTKTTNNSSHQIETEDNKFDDEFEAKSYASHSHSVIKDLPIFSKTNKQNNKPIRKNRSAPSLSTMQQEKLETQLYLHPRQIPRSLSETFADYQPDTALSILMTLPMEAYMGIGGGNVKTLLQKALKQVDDELDVLTDEEEEDLRIDSSVNQSQAIPSAPYSIPPTIEQDFSTNKQISPNNNNQCDELPAPPSPPQNIEKINNNNNNNNDNDIQYFDKRQHAQSVKHDIEQALKQGYTTNLCIAIIQALIGAFLYGWNVAILNVPQKTVQTNQTHMSDTEYALLATMFCAGGLIGALVAGPLQDKIGRKKSLLIVDIIFIISAFLTYFYAIGLFGDIDNQSTYFWFWLGRFIVGIACGAATAIVPTYLGEISPPLIRGAVGTSNQLTICFGVVMVELVGYKNILGGNDTWQYLFICNALPILQLMSAFTFPESPKWLVQKGKDSEARQALQKLRQTNDVRIDMMLMKGGLLHEQTFHSPHVSPKRKLIKNQQKKDKGTAEPLLNDHNTQIEVVTKNVSLNINQSILRGPFGMTLEMWKAVKWATIIAIVLMLMQQFSGINAVFYYSSTILNHADVTSDEAVWLGSLGISIANFFAVFIAVFSIDRAGRKLLLILSCIAMILASILVSIAIMLSSYGTFWQYSSIGFLILFVIGFEIGLGAIPWLMMAELAPMQYRGVIVAIATASNWGANLLIAQFSGPIIKLFYFYPFAIVCFLGIIFTVKFIPETNGKTAQEIQTELQNI